MRGGGSRTAEGKSQDDEEVEAEDEEVAEMKTENPGIIYEDECAKRAEYMTST